MQDATILETTTSPSPCSIRRLEVKLDRLAQAVRPDLADHPADRGSKSTSGPAERSGEDWEVKRRGSLGRPARNATFEGSGADPAKQIGPGAEGLPCGVVAGCCCGERLGEIRLQLERVAGALGVGDSVKAREEQVVFKVADPICRSGVGQQGHST